MEWVGQSCQFGIVIFPEAAERTVLIGLLLPIIEQFLPAIDSFQRNTSLILAAPSYYSRDLFNAYTMLIVEFIEHRESILRIRRCFVPRASVWD